MQLFSILVIAFFLVKDGHRLLEFFYKQIPEERARRFRKIAGDISDAIAGYVFGNFVISVLRGAGDLRDAADTRGSVRLTAGDPVRVLRPDPARGRDTGRDPRRIVVAFAADFPIGLIVWAAVLILYQQMENNLIQPFVYGKAVQLHPLIVIVAILIGAALLGVLGALMAIPAAAADSGRRARLLALQAPRAGATGGRRGAGRGPAEAG